MKNKIKLIDDKVIAWFIVTFAIVYSVIAIINSLALGGQVLGIKYIIVSLIAFMIIVMTILVSITTIKLSKFIKGVRKCKETARHL